MPLYEYRCDDCSKVFEMLRRMSEADQTGPGSGVACPKCESKRVTRQWSTFAAAGGSSAQADAGGCAKPGCGARAGFS